MKTNLKYEIRNQSPSWKGDWLSRGPEDVRPSRKDSREDVDPNEAELDRLKIWAILREKGSEQTLNWFYIYLMDI